MPRDPDPNLNLDRYITAVIGSGPFQAYIRGRQAASAALTSLVTAAAGGAGLLYLNAANVFTRLTLAADKGLYATSSSAISTFDLTAFGRSFVDDANAAAGRTTLGVAIGTDVQAYSARLADIAALAVTDGNIIVGDGANWVAESGATARTSLGLGTGDSPTFTTVTAGLTVPDGSAVVLQGSGTGTGDVVERVGATATEAFRLVVYDETVNPSAIETNLINLPAGSMLVSVQANVETALTGGGTTVTWSIGTAADPDKYGSAGFSSITGSAAADSLAQNGKVTWFGDGSHAFSLSASAEQLVLTGCATGGAADGDTALTVGSVRVRAIYWQLQALDDA